MTPFEFWLAVLACLGVVGFASGLSLASFLYGFSRGKAARS